MKKSVAASEKPVKAKEFDKELFKRSVEYNVRTLYRKNLEEADAQQIFQAVSYAIKDRIVENWMETQKAYEKEDPKMVYYMSMEFLMGRALGNNLINLKAYKPVAEALEELGLESNNFASLSKITSIVNKENFPKLKALKLSGCRRNDTMLDMTQMESG